MDEKKNLRTLSEHDAHRRAVYSEESKGTPNGISCPKCCSELSDSGDTILTARFPRQAVYCSSCGWGGTRIV